MELRAEGAWWQPSARRRPPRMADDRWGSSDDSEEEPYQEARIIVEAGAGSGNRFTGAVAAFGATTSSVKSRTTVPAKPRYAQKKLSNAQLSGNVLLVERGKVTFQQKALRAQAAGAVACVFVNSDNQPFVPFGDGDEEEATIGIPCCCLAQSDGEWLLKAAPSVVTIEFEPSGGWDAGSCTERARVVSKEDLRGSLYSDGASAASDPLRLSVATSGLSGSTGLTAPTAGSGVATFARARYSYKSDHARDLVFSKGEIIEVVDGASVAADARCLPACPPGPAVLPFGAPTVAEC